MWLTTLSCSNVHCKREITPYFVCDQRFSPQNVQYIYTYIYIYKHTYKLQIYKYTWLMYVSDSSYTLAALHATLQRKNVIPMVYKYVKLCTRLKRKHTFINSTFFLCTLWNHLQRYSPIICLYMDLWDRSFSFMLSKQFGLSLIMLLSITNNCFSIVQHLCFKLLLSNVSYYFNLKFLSYELCILFRYFCRFVD